MSTGNQQDCQRFDAVVGPHFEALFRAAMRLTRCREDAEDLVQEVAIRAMPELPRLADLEAPRAWLLRVQYRLFVDQTRRRVRSPITASDAAVNLAAAELPGPAELAAHSEQQLNLARVWPQLNRSQRALLAMHAEGYSLAELEVITGLSRNAIGVRLHRARARLGRLLSNDATDQPVLAQGER